jgi:excisionase family DNA binding protein
MLAEKDRLLNRSEAAEHLGIKPQTLAIWATTGRYGLPFIKVGRLAKYRQRDLDKFLERRTVGASAE